MHDLTSAARELSGIAAEVGEHHLDRPTPCGEWSVRDLLLHLLGLTSHFTSVARKRPSTPPELLELPDDWRAHLDVRLDDLAAAWQDPHAWTGDGEAGGVRMPNADLGIVALEEIVLHGWDLARAVDVRFSVSDADVTAVRGFVAGFEHAGEAVRAGLYGPVVGAQPADARPADAQPDAEFAQVLALAGRSPRWSATLVDAEAG